MSFLRNFRFLCIISADVSYEPNKVIEYTDQNNEIEDRQ